MCPNSVLIILKYRRGAGAVLSLVDSDCGPDAVLGGWAGLGGCSGSSIFIGSVWSNSV
ncbi:hypothetical protein JYU34_014116 [Plutella xylostella]|uniref:Uncharacterized protein n=1 Tax=Plutella xylostella TaxID=51655 RepID=A0ABQ7PQ57_PLUXY|nr:hypothetical protein JYU34_022510 [Plutella xylostella]KAG7301225.1 hypothetical protein JYU34_014116 [Plutella xylostella]